MNARKLVSFAVRFAAIVTGVAIAMAVADQILGVGEQFGDMVLAVIFGLILYNALGDRGAEERTIKLLELHLRDIDSRIDLLEELHTRVGNPPSRQEMDRLHPRKKPPAPPEVGR